MHTPRRWRSDSRKSPFLRVQLTTAVGRTVGGRNGTARSPMPSYTPGAAKATAAQPRHECRYARQVFGKSAVIETTSTAPPSATSPPIAFVVATTISVKSGATLAAHQERRRQKKKSVVGRRPNTAPQSSDGAIDAARQRSSIYVTSHADAVGKSYYKMSRACRVTPSSYSLNIMHSCARRRCRGHGDSSSFLLICMGPLCRCVRGTIINMTPATRIARG